MVRYVQLAAASGAEGLAALQSRVAALEQQLAPPPPPAAAAEGAEGGAGAARAARRAGQEQRGEGPLRRLLGSEPVRRLLRPRSLERAASGLLLVASLLGGQQLGWRVLRTAPLLFLLQRRPAGEGRARGRAGRRAAE